MEKGQVVNCPELVDGQPCNWPAEIQDVHELPSTDGPYEHIKTLCLRGHVLFMPSDMIGEDNGSATI